MDDSLNDLLGNNLGRLPDDVQRLLDQTQLVILRQDGELEAKLAALPDRALIHLCAAMAVSRDAGAHAPGADLQWDPAALLQSVRDEIHRRGLPDPAA